MLKPHQTLSRLQRSCRQPGYLEWIGLRSSHRAEMKIVDHAMLLEGAGIKGDHRSGFPSPGKRQVTLIQTEHLPVIASLCQHDQIDPALLRRNLVVSKINLHALKNLRFSLGNAILEGTGYCHPCSRMEENLGYGGYNAVRGHGGITARVIKSGEIRLGDQLVIIGCS